MRPIRVYADTSVFGGTQDPRFRGPSCRFFKRVHKGEFRLLLSAATLRELSQAPQAVRDVWRCLPPASVEEVALSGEVHQLASEYVESNVLGQAAWADALHVAAATVAAADLILSWNFRHIVNFNRIRGFNGVNVRWGYRPMTILSPLEIGDEEAQDA